MNNKGESISNILIKEYQKGQEFQIHQLIKNVYDEFVSSDYSEEGNQLFYDWISPSAIALRQTKLVNLWVAIADKEIIGMIEIRNQNQVTLLFVDKMFHGQGVARQLFQTALKTCLQRQTDIKKFNVHASPFSIPAYQKLGFKAIDVMQEQQGIKYLPMELIL